MTDRHLIAYLIFAVLLVAAVLVVLYRRHEARIEHRRRSGRRVD